MCLETFPFGDGRSASSIVNMSESDATCRHYSVGPSWDSIHATNFTMPRKISHMLDWPPPINGLFLCCIIFSSLLVLASSLHECLKSELKL